MTEIIVPKEARLDAAALGRQEAAKILAPLKATLEAYQVFPTDVIVAKWIRETLGRVGGKTSLIAAEQTQKEDRYQGKTGLIIKLGSHAFVDEGDLRFYDFRPKEGDWVQFRNSDGDDSMLVPAGTMDGYHIRRLWHGHIAAILPHPDMIF